jgi:hypothetical protein
LTYRRSAAGIKESLFESEILADYLLYRMNLRPGTAESPYPGLPLLPSFTDRTNVLHELLNPLAQRLGTLMVGGIPDVDAAQRYLLKSFGEGKLGRWTLDDLLRYRQTAEEAEGEQVDINSAVDRTVSLFLQEQADQRMLRLDGVPESLSQEKKKARRAAVEERKKKWEAKMVRAPGDGGTAATGKNKSRR